MLSQEWEKALERIKRIQKSKQSNKGKTNGTTSPRTTCYNLADYGIFKRFQGVTFDSIQSKGINSENIKNNFEICRKYADNFSDYARKGVGLIMLGQYGTLKTTLAVAILRQVIEQGEKGLLIAMPSLMDNLFNMGRLNPAECAIYEKKIRNTKLLIIDDLGGENINVDWVKAKINSIITERHAKLLPTIITTNLSPQELTDTYEGRIIDRLRTSNLQLLFRGESVRQKFNA